ncbi:phage T7 F exclusion suppressor FxsA [Fictibacillus macauensis ZFHKF-1]|uniref:Phage T7 F exclusion suppressor FxsA n=1 Tax=Fictibacillus macauensis ZFHKF-1 TaxID=1196324 RepID=I8AIX2_9BACL|nr:FxsA family protein [Fictibacillus macauensis]EIT85439.1 phage T7 F exclusion suppressor FxsA [Fictibacillus macauensis ZFHKF-1]
MRALVLFFLIVSVGEIAIAVWIGHLLGALPTIAIIVITSFFGAWLAKRQGLHVVKNVKQQLQYGQVPSQSLLDGLCIVLGGLLLLIPGFLTDVVGLLLLFPPTRVLAKVWVVKYVGQKINKGAHRVHIKRS